MAKTFTAGDVNMINIRAGKPCSSTVPTTTQLLPQKMMSTRLVETSGPTRTYRPRLTSPDINHAGGIVIPENAQSKVLHGEVVAVGPGSRKENGDFIPVFVNFGDKVLFPEYDGTKVSLEYFFVIFSSENLYYLFRETDVFANIEN